MASPSLYNRIKTFCVGLIQPTLSDHCPIMATIEVKADIQVYNYNSDFIERPKKIPWNKEIAVRFENLLQNFEQKTKLTSLMDGPFTSQSDIDRCTSGLTELN